MYDFTQKECGIVAVFYDDDDDYEGSGGSGDDDDDDFVDESYIFLER